MANFTAGAFAVNMFEITLAGYAGGEAVFGASSIRIYWPAPGTPGGYDPDSYLTFGGSFLYAGPPADGDLIGGTVTSVSERDDGETTFTLTGLSLDATYVAQKVLADQGFEALVEGLKGADQITGSSLNDRLGGFEGADTINGDAGNDALFGWTGADSLVGGAGQDELAGQDGDDTVLGGAETDLLSGGLGADSLDGGDGDDNLNSGAGNDTYRGGAGSDLLNYSAAPYAMSVNLQSGTATGGGETDTIIDVERFYGTAFADTFLGGTGAHNVQGLGGDDSVTGGGGADSISGQEGNDTAEGGAGQDYLVGGVGDDELFGDDDADTLVGGDGADILEGGFGGDWLQGGNGDDVLEGEAGVDTLEGGDGADALISLNEGSEGDAWQDSLNGGAGADFYIVDAGDRIADFAADDDAIVFVTAQPLGNIQILVEGTRTEIRAYAAGLGTYQSIWIEQKINPAALSVETYSSEGENGVVVRRVPPPATRLEQVAIDVPAVRTELAASVQANWSEVKQAFVSDAFSQVKDAVLDEDALALTLSRNIRQKALYQFLTAGKALAGGYLKVVDVGKAAFKLGTYIDDAFIGPLYWGSTPKYQTPAEHADAIAEIIIELTGIADLPFGETAVKFGKALFREFADEIYAFVTENVVATAQAMKTALEKAAEGLAAGAQTDGPDVQFKGDDKVSYEGGGGDDSFVGSLLDGLFGAPADLGATLRAAGLAEATPMASAGSPTNDTFNGGSGVDAVSYGSATAAIAIDLAAGTAQGADIGLDSLIDIEDALGGRGADSIRGSSGANELTGAEGADTLDGGLGDDTLNGGDGLDTATYASASSGVIVSLAGGTAAGGGGGDALTGVEALVGSAYADTLVGDGGANSLAGGAGADSLAGGDGGDRLKGGAGADVLNGGNGYDFADFSDLVAGVTVDLTNVTGHGGGAAGDTLTDIEAVTGTGLSDQIFGDGGSNWLEGRDGADALVGGNGADTLLGGADADQMRGGAGLDRLEGGTGNDIYLLENDVDQVIETGGAGFDAVWAGLDYVLPANVEKLVSMTGFGVLLTGNGLDNEVVGNGGADTLYGLGGSDLMEGNGGTDLIYGGLGADLIRGGAGNDRILGEQGVDHVFGGAGDDIFFVFNEADQVFENANEGFDTVFTDMAWTAGANIEKVVSATNFAVALNGNALGNELVGNGGNDTVKGLDGSDILEGRGGNDLLEGGSSGDGLYGGDGADTLDGGLGADFLFGAAGVDRFLVKGEGVDTLAGFVAGEDDVVLSAALYGAADAGGGVARLVVGPGAVATSALATLLFDPTTGQLRYDADGTGAGAAVLIARFTGDLAAFSTADLIFGP